jgi:membrane protease subunit HflK
VRRRTTELLDAEQVGVTIEECNVESRPPLYLKDAFASVLNAEFARRKALDDAHSYENTRVIKAGADAESRINIAETARKQLVASLAADAERFNTLLPQYERDPDLFVRQYLSETMGRVLANVQEKLFLPENALRYLLLNRDPPKKKTETTSP